MVRVVKTIKVKINNPNKGKEEALESTVEILNGVLSTYIDFTLAHNYFLTQTKEVMSKRTGKVRKRLLNNLEILTEVEKISMITKAHPEGEIDIKSMYPNLPTLFRRSIINTSTGMCKSYLANRENWKNRKKKNKSKNPPSPPSPKNLPTFYSGTYQIELLDIQNQFVRLKVYENGEWVFKNYPIKIGKKQMELLTKGEWTILSPTLVPKKKKGNIEWYLHIPVEKRVDVLPIEEQKKENPNLTTLSVDMGLKHIAVITVRKSGESPDIRDSTAFNGKVVFVKFFRGEKIESHRLRHLQKIFNKQKKSGKAVSGEKSSKALWKHISEMNDAYAHKVSREIIEIAQKFGVSVIIIENLRKFMGMFHFSQEITLHFL